MLEISKITTTVTHKEDWLKSRIGKITASKFGCLISEKSDVGIFTKTATTYLEGLAGEILTGKRATEEFFNNATNHGNAIEPIAIDYFCKELKMYPLRNADGNDTHRLIIHCERSGCTPDGLLSPYQEAEKLFDETGNFIKVSPLETKCPLLHHRFIKLFKCLTPLDLKKTESDYYWQLVFQMICCNSLKGYFGAYNEDFNPKGRLIEFRKIELMEDFKKANATLKFAKIELEKTIKLFNNGI